ncbi:hypothetical protein BCR35DRAFT_350858 [Leucosporidium creatinivorum]|uniref:Mid2 domain-containing protein n=1 Tax=Leucosporidium creatinivorum TaxID=106004 RepID=A0A1Y2FZH9_9BASI|nr:hypothetical protein BCR35DRAFT_350858 [Leucosporidium creatinivorum]
MRSVSPLSLFTSLFLLAPLVLAIDPDLGHKMGEGELMRKRAVADEALASFVSTAIAEESASASAASISTRFSRVTRTSTTAPTAVAAAATSSESSSAVVSSATASSTPFPDNLYIPFSHLTQTTKIALCVGVGIAVLLLIFLITWCVSRRTSEDEDPLSPAGQHLSFDDRATKLPTRRRKSYKTLGDH